MGRVTLITTLVLVSARLAWAQFDALAAESTPSFGDICGAIGATCDASVVPGCDYCPDVFLFLTATTSAATPEDRCVNRDPNSPAAQCATCREQNNFSYGYRSFFFRGRNSGNCFLRVFEAAIAEISADVLASLDGLEVSECRDKSEGNFYGVSLLTEVARIFCTGSGSQPAPVARSAAPSPNDIVIYSPSPSPTGYDSPASPAINRPPPSPSMSPKPSRSSKPSAAKPPAASSSLPRKDKDYGSRILCRRSDGVNGYFSPVTGLFLKCEYCPSSRRGRTVCCEKLCGRGVRSRSYRYGYSRRLPGGHGSRQNRSGRGETRNCMQNCYVGQAF